MDFFKLLQSLDELLYEIMSWLIFYPITLWRAVTRPRVTMDRIESDRPKAWTWTYSSWRHACGRIDLRSIVHSASPMRGYVPCGDGLPCRSSSKHCSVYRACAGSRVRFERQSPHICHTERLFALDPFLQSFDGPARPFIIRPMSLEIRENPQSFSGRHGRHLEVPVRIATYALVIAFDHIGDALSLFRLLSQHDICWAMSVTPGLE
jgi:hypothetical protein